MHKQERDAYQVLNTSWETLYNPNLKYDEAKRNSVIKYKYEQKVKRIEQQLNYQYNTEEKKEEFRQEIKACDWAYPLIATEKARDLYNKEKEKLREKEIENLRAQKRGELRSTDEKFKYLKEEYREKRRKIETAKIGRETQKNRFEKFREQYQYKGSRQEHPYRNLKISPDDSRITSCTKREKNEILKKLRDKQLEALYRQLKNLKDLTEKYRIIIGIHDVKQAYEQIITEEELNKYCHSTEYDPELVKTSQINHKMLYKNKLLGKKVELSNVYAFEDRENRNLRVRKVAKIVIIDIEGKLQTVYGYELKRTIKGKEKIDTIYTEIDMPQFNNKKNEEKNFDKEKNDFIINELFSEEMIDGAKYNEGYIGSIEKDIVGQYRVTLEKKKLSEKEKKMLTAVMMQKEREREEMEENKEER